MRELLSIAAAVGYSPSDAATASWTTALPKVSEAIETRFAVVGQTLTQPTPESVDLFFSCFSLDRSLRGNRFSLNYLRSKTALEQAILAHLTAQDTQGDAIGAALQQWLVYTRVVRWGNLMATQLSEPIVMTDRAFAVGDEDDTLSAVWEAQNAYKQALEASCKHVVTLIITGEHTGAVPPEQLQQSIQTLLSFVGLRGYRQWLESVVLAEAEKRYEACVEQWKAMDTLANAEHNQHTEPKPGTGQTDHMTAAKECRHWQRVRFIDTLMRTDAERVRAMGFHHSTATKLTGLIERHLVKATLDAIHADPDAGNLLVTTDLEAIVSLHRLAPKDAASVMAGPITAALSAQANTIPAAAKEMESTVAERCIALFGAWLDVVSRHLAVGSDAGPKKKPLLAPTLRAVFAPMLTRPLPLDIASKNEQNSEPTKIVPSEGFAWICDHLIRRRVPLTEQQLRSLELIAGCIDDGETLIRFLTTFLAKRLLRRAEQVTETAAKEQQLLACLASRLGRGATKRLEQMITEGTTIDTWQQPDATPSPGGVPPAVLAVRTLCMWRWPSFSDESFTMPAEMKLLVDGFVPGYKARHPTHTLRWVPFVGRVVLRRCGDVRGCRDVDASPYQAAMLLLFNARDAWTVADVAARLNVSVETAAANLQLLAAGTAPLLRVSQDTTCHEVFELNGALSTSKALVVPLPSSRVAAPAAVSNEQKEVERIALESRVVRMMKRMARCGFAELHAQVGGSHSTLRRCVERLVAREFLRMSEGDVVEYLA